MVHVGNALMDSAVEMIDVGEGLMREEVAFQIAPGSLDVVQFRSVFRQPFDGQPIAHGERSLRGLAGMDRAVVENQDDGLVWAARAWPVDRVEAAEEGNKVAAALGGAGSNAGADRVALAQFLPNAAWTAGGARPAGLPSGWTFLETRAAANLTTNFERRRWASRHPRSHRG